MKPWILLSFLLIATSAVAQQRNPSDYTRFLLPVLEGGASANGANWTVRLDMRNDGPKTLDAFPLRADCFCCAQCLQLRGFPAFQPNQDGIGEHGGLPAPYALWVGGSPGAFLYVERAAVSQLSAHLEISGGSSEPTTIPIVAESEFLSGGHSVTAVPIASTARVTVRVYQLEPRSGSQISVRVYEIGGQLLAEQTLAFTTVPIEGCPQPVVCPAVAYHPGYAQLSDLGVQGAQRIRIEFEPADPSESYWPLVTVTNNATNAVQTFAVR